MLQLLRIENRTPGLVCEHNPLPVTTQWANAMLSPARYSKTPHSGQKIMHSGRTGIQAPPSLRLLDLPQHHVSGIFGDHHGGGVGVTRHQTGHYRGIDNSQSLNPPDFQFRIND